jgi:hypothetical protein
VGDRTRTGDNQIHSLENTAESAILKFNSDNDLQPEAQEVNPLACCPACRTIAECPDLAHLVERWPTLPEPIRAAVRALIRGVGERE